MKAALIIYMLSFPTMTAIAQQGFVIQAIPIHEKYLDDAIGDYIVENEEDLSEFGVIVVKFDPTTSCYYLTHKMFKSEIREWMPSFYSSHKNKIIIYYTGFENNLKITPENNKVFLSATDRYLAEDANQLFYHAPIWKVVENKNGYTKEVVDRIPLPY